MLYRSGHDNGAYPERSGRLGAGGFRCESQCLASCISPTSHIVDETWPHPALVYALLMAGMSQCSPLHEEAHQNASHGSHGSSAQDQDDMQRRGLQLMARYNAGCPNFLNSTGHTVRKNTAHCEQVRMALVHCQIRMHVRETMEQA